MDSISCASTVIICSVSSTNSTSSTSSTNSTSVSPNNRTTVPEYYLYCYHFLPSFPPHPATPCPAPPRSIHNVLFAKPLVSKLEDNLLKCMGNSSVEAKRKIHELERRARRGRAKAKADGGRHAAGNGSGSGSDSER